MMWLPRSATDAMAALRVEPPGEGRRRVGHVVLGVDAAEAHDLADLAGCDDLAGERDHRVLQVVEADGGRHAGLLGGVGHLLRLGGVRARAASRNRPACRRRCAASAIGLCSVLGVVMSTRSTAGSATSVCQSPVDAGEAERLRRLGGDRRSSTSASSSSTGAERQVEDAGARRGTQAHGCGP